MDVLGAYHGHFWHNMRFYYNPVSARLEPIGFDGFGEVDTPLKDQIVLGYKVDAEYPEEDIVRWLFRDPDFFSAYMKHLNRISPRNDKYLMACPYCAEKIQSNSLYCSHCGKHIFLLSSDTRLYCTACEASVQSDWKFCMHCGSKLQGG